MKKHNYSHTIKFEKICSTNSFLIQNPAVLFPFWGIALYLTGCITTRLILSLNLFLWTLCQVFYYINTRTLLYVRQIRQIDQSLYLTDLVIILSGLLYNLLGTMQYPKMGIALLDFVSRTNLCCVFFQIL